MSRFRVMLLTTGLFVLTATVALNGWAQGPGGGRGGRGGPGGGGRGGPGGFGGFGGGWGGGPGGDSLLGLAMKSAVQEELKVSDKQKTQISSLNEDYNQRRQRIFDSMRQNGNGNGGGNGRRGGNRGNNGGNGNNNAGVQAPGGFGTGNNITPFTSGYDLNPYTLNTPQQTVQIQQDGQQDDGRARFQQMREAMNGLDEQANTTLARILSGKQYQRLNQIQIQSQGINALVRPDVAEKIQLDETQVAAIQGVINDRRSAQRDVFSKQGNLFRSFRNQNGGGGGNGNNAGDGAAAKKDNQAGANATGDQAKGNGNGPGNGGNRRRGGPNGGGPGGGPPNREAMKKFMEQPEVKAQMDETQAAMAKLDNQSTQAAYKILTKYQLASFKKLQGPPFDVSKLRPNFGGGNRDSNAVPAKSANAAAEKKSDTAKETAKETASAKADSKKSSTAKAKAKSTTKTKRTTRRQPQGFDEGADGFGDFPSDFDQN